MNLTDAIARVKYKLDDPEGSYCDDEYVKGFVADAYENLYNKLRLSGYQFDESTVVLPAVGPVRDLSAYLDTGKMLYGLVNPRALEWKLPGLDDTNWRPVAGPLDRVRDITPGPYLDSWSWIRSVIFLSAFSVALDLRVTGDFILPPLTAPDSPVLLDATFGHALVMQLAWDIAKARGNANWVQLYKVDAQEAIDDLFCWFVMQNQAKTRRLGSITRRRSSLGVYPTQR